ncbi:Major facilitator superfamily domain, general substrate transporter [Cordyceps fumosorosea ARSEF 2679]|uniref:Major facilitator superfamily domain, general substrate transporter n=1 Tax=Cordyceps fumosorosea (strain ARSEF 2679) TaxID=1081104 RepID=A0A168D8L5_CORFA|nr:Major facilitator superfamily domain, general substrate transporter [Cordyceps fumosorosea ARSEF 2679]OAA72293.1 Major facilitator superfamily domain, general substrate transporter [Cordyceps fumosorosea ARSEF 2679]
MTEISDKDAPSVAASQARANGDSDSVHAVPASAPKLPDRYADESFRLFSEVKVTDPTPEEAVSIRNKLIWRILPFLCIGYHLMFLDKQTLGSSAILGILKDAHLSANQYNWLSSIFYFGYMIAEFPQNWALQRFPVAKWLAANLVIWGGITLLHIPCRNFASLFVVRFLLGLSEACIVPAFLLIMSMFFTYQEQAVLMPIMWSVGNGSPIASGLLSYGVLHIHTNQFAPWQWLMFLCGAVTILFGVFVYLLLPDSPLYAHFLTPEERAKAILRIKENHSGIEQKRFKREQFIEAIKDPKTWLFTAHALTQEMANGTTNQYSLLINSFGFTVLQTTLLGAVLGAFNFTCLALAAVALRYTTNSRAWISLFAYIPTALSSVLLLSLPSRNRWGLITGIWIRSATGVPYAVVMIWAANASAGHTKKTTVIALYHAAYGLGNIISPQLFRPQWKPRYRPTWIILLVVAAIVPAIIVLVLRIYLDRENKRRDRIERENLVDDSGVVETVNADGTTESRVVDRNQLDLTDRQNLKFRYVL